MVQRSLGCWNILTPAQLNSCSLLLGFAAGPESAACSCGRAGFAQGVGASQQETREVPRDGSGLAEKSSALGAGERAGELCSVPNRGAALLSACIGGVLALCARSSGFEWQKQRLPAVPSPFCGEGGRGRARFCFCVSAASCARLSAQCACAKPTAAEFGLRLLWDRCWCLNGKKIKKIKRGGETEAAVAHMPRAGQGLVGEHSGCACSPGRRFVPGATSSDAVQSPDSLWGDSTAFRGLWLLPFLSSSVRCLMS